MCNVSMYYKYVNKSINVDYADLIPGAGRLSPTSPFYRVPSRSQSESKVNQFIFNLIADLIAYFIVDLATSTSPPSKLPPSLPPSTSTQGVRLFPWKRMKMGGDLKGGGPGRRAGEGGGFDYWIGRLSDVHQPGVVWSNQISGPVILILNLTEFPFFHISMESYLYINIYMCVGSPVVS